MKNFDHKIVTWSYVFSLTGYTVHPPISYYTFAPSKRFNIKYFYCNVYKITFKFEGNTIKRIYLWYDTASNYQGDFEIYLEFRKFPFLFQIDGPFTSAL